MSAPKPARRSIPALAWTLKTALQKRFIDLASHLGLNSYRRWLERNPRPPAPSLPPGAPTVSFILWIEVHNPPGLEGTLASLRGLETSAWDLRACLAPGTALTPAPGLALETVQLGQPPTPLAPLLSSLKQACGDYFMLVDPGDSFPPDFLAAVLGQVDPAQPPQVIYFDEDCLNPDGQPLYPILKPHYSPELLLSNNYLAHALFSRALLGPIAARLAGSQRGSPGELVYAAAEAAGSFLHIPHPIYHARSARPDPARLLADVEAHLRRLGLPGARARLADSGQVRATWDFQPERISIVIPTRDRLECLERCLSSLFERTDYPAYEVILVDNASRDPRVPAYYRALQADGRPLRVVEGGEDFNYNRFNNLGAQVSSGSYLLFLNNDVEITQPDWLSELAMWASRPEVGAVGARLLYPNGTIQHAGIVVGLEGHASHIFMDAHTGLDGIFGSPVWYRDYLAVTGACLMMRHTVFDQLGGFDERYKLVFSDVDLCLRAVEAGYRVVYNPWAELVHHEGRTRGRYIPPEDIRRAYGLLSAWVAAGDPCFNPNLSHALKIPALRFPGEESPSRRLEKILKYKG